MSRKRDRVSAKGLLPRMEARPWADGKTFTYRVLKIDGTWERLGTNRAEALQKVLDMNGANTDRGSVDELWRLYQESPDWHQLSDATRTDYRQSSAPLLKVFGRISPATIKPVHCNRYLRVERVQAPVRANREMALLSNLMNLAINRGDIDVNPCKQVRRNKERPRDVVPESADLTRFLEWARARGGQSAVLAAMAEYAALAGNRRIEFRQLHWTDVEPEVVRLKRAKQRGRVTIEAVGISERLAELFKRLRGLALDADVGAVFPNRDGNPHTERGFKSAWSRLMSAALKAGVLHTRITFHDLRAYYTTHYKLEHGVLPDLHANPATTARVYDRSKEVKRGAL